MSKKNKKAKSAGGAPAYPSKGENKGHEKNHSSLSKTPHRKHPQNPKHAASAQNKVSDPAPYQITLAEDSDSDTYQPVATSSQAPPSGSTLGGLTKLQSNLAAKLTGSRFRVLNEELYTTTSEESFKRFQANPELFSDYHVGFREQTNGWDEVRQEKKDKKGKKEIKKEKKGGVEWEAGANATVNGNPVNWIIEFIRRSASDSGPTFPITIADLGCGDAAIALALTSKKKKKKSKQEYIVHSLDMVTPQPPSPLNSIITACNIAKTPLRDKSVDIGVYSLALMGTDIFNILSECARVMKVNGVVYISEVRSRFNGTSDGSMLPRFFNLMEVLGFEAVNKDARKKNKFFVLMIFKKVSDRRGKDKDVEGEGDYLKPCIYKRR